LTDKPVLAVEHREDQLEEVDDVVRPVAEHLGSTGEAIGVCVQLEAEAAQLDAGERAELMEGLGLRSGRRPQGGPGRVPTCSVLRTFLHHGGTRSHAAWIFPVRRPRPRCARGVNPLDLQRGFHPRRG